MKNVFILLGPGVLDGEKRQWVAGIMDFLKEKSIDFYTLDDVSKFSGLGLNKKVDLMIVCGGDGTTLGAARYCAPNSIPMLVFNFGTRGFLAAEKDSSKFIEILNKVLIGLYFEENRILLECKVLRNNDEVGSLLALNELNIRDAGVIKVLTFNLGIRDSFSQEFIGDGIMISTPTGSTGCTMYAGPIIEPGIKCMLIRVVNQFGLYSMAPLVVDQDRKLNIDLVNSNSRNLRVISDGQEFLKVLPGDRLVIKKYCMPARFLSLNNDPNFKSETFWKTLSGLK